MSSIKIVFTDLDGTLLISTKQISRANIDCLCKLGRQNVIRVISTGRSLFSFNKLFDQQLPVDYLIFSTGSGIVDLNTHKLLFSSSLEAEDIHFIASYLMKHTVDFMVHQPVPDNHYFSFFMGQKNNPDFTRRIKIYRDYGDQFTVLTSLPEKSAQIIAIFPNDPDRFELIKKGLTRYTITRTTSPLDGQSIWMEITPAAVSKGNSAKWLCSHLHFDSINSLGIGNDYNDVSLLDFTRASYMVANGPKELQNRYLSTLSNDDDGFCHAVYDAKVLLACRT